MADETKKGRYDGFKDILFLMDYLVDNTSEQHKISQAELEMALHRYMYPDDRRSEKVYVPNYATSGIPERVKRFLDSFTGERLLGFLELCQSDEEFSGPAKTAKKYYMEGPLSESTVSILRDAISVYPYAEQKKTKQIINELDMLTNKYNRTEYNLPQVDANKYPGTYYENLCEIYKALSTTKADEYGERLKKSDYDKNRDSYETQKKASKKVSKLSMEYCRYEFDAEKNKFVLTPQKMKNGCTVRCINPLMLLWSNGYYYLIAYYYQNSEYHYMNLRVDRMKNVKCLDQPADEYNDRRYFRNNKFDPKLYRTHNPVMHASGKRCDKIVIKCSRSILNNALDTFGFDIKVLAQNDKDLCFEVRNTTPTGVLMWALEYCEDCEILEPDSLRRKMAEYADHITGKYS